MATMNNTAYLINRWLEQEKKKVEREFDFSLGAELIQWQDTLKYSISICTHSIVINAYCAKRLIATSPINTFIDFLEFLERYWG